MPVLVPTANRRRSASSRTSALLPKAYIQQSQTLAKDAGALDKLWDEFVKTRSERLRNQLMEHYLPLVRAVAERTHLKLPSHVDIEELIQAGVFGLMAAIDGFDPTRGVKFEAYCRTRIGGAILDDLREQDFAPRLVRTNSHRLERVIKEIEAETGQQPKEDEVAKRLGISTEELDRWMREINKASIVSLDRAAHDGEADGREVRTVDTVVDRKAASPLSSLQKRELIELACKGLSQKEKLIVVLYYLEEVTMKEIGTLLGLSESRVCQIHNRIMERLKRQFEKVREDLMTR